MQTIESRLGNFLGKAPQIHPTAYIHPTAILLGDVRIGAGVTILPYAVLRADINYIEIGSRSNVQDGTIIHLSDDYPAIVGQGVTIGHAAVIHACTIEDGVLIGMRATVLDGSVVGRDSIVGACTLVTKNTVIPSHSLVIGIPGKVVRQVSEEEVTASRELGEKYVAVGTALGRGRGPE